MAIIWPARGAPIIDPDFTAFGLACNHLTSCGMFSAENATCGGWAYPGAQYTQGDLVHVKGQLSCAWRCTQEPCPDSPESIACNYPYITLQVGGGDANGLTGAPGFSWTLADSRCTRAGQNPIAFDCAITPIGG
jgi:hypothetical protein